MSYSFTRIDCLVLANVDELFQNNQLSASPECCDRFNAGVLVVEPSLNVFHDMLSKLNVLDSYDGGDQGNNMTLSKVLLQKVF